MRIDIIGKGSKKNSFSFCTWEYSVNWVGEEEKNILWNYIKNPAFCKYIWEVRFLKTFHFLPFLEGIGNFLFWYLTAFFVFKLRMGPCKNRPMITLGLGCCCKSIFSQMRKACWKAMPSPRGDTDRAGKQSLGYVVACNSVLPDLPLVIPDEKLQRGRWSPLSQNTGGGMSGQKVVGTIFISAWVTSMSSKASFPCGLSHSLGAPAECAVYYSNCQLVSYRLSSVLTL